ncbi:ABC transporter ATP-binding protein [Clostridia bacterium]|nr:ABC transporter ATP-binding protein [Clostridia bacterium]
MAENILEMRDIVKQFPGVLANDHVTFKVEKGEVHTLLGENGAGKSTLMNILYGLYSPTSGEIWLHGKKVDIHSPRVAIENGIGMVHQHFMLIPALTVIENVILGMTENKQVLDLDGAANAFVELAQKYNMKIDPYEMVENLTVGEQQRVEILKALYRGADLLILDEPTAVLTPQEVDELFKMIDTLTGEGHTVIFISHKLNEVMHISNRVTVLRSGKSCETVLKENTDKHELARLMVGREIDLDRSIGKPQLGDVVLEMKDVECVGDKGINALNGLNLTVRKGEILGIAGVDGNGQDEMLDVIAGLRKVTKGSIKICGTDSTNSNPREIMKRGVAHIPADRHKRGMISEMSIKENLMLIDYYKPPFAKGKRLNWNEIEKSSERLLKEFNVKAPSIETAGGSLSGGNQQKMVLARELDRDPEFLIAAHPVRGLDIGATEFVHERLIAERANGVGILLVSTELEEILTLADRIAVIYEGEIMGVIEAEDATVAELGLMMAGSKKQDF